MKQELKKAKELLKRNPDVTSVSIGYRYRNGKRTEEKCIVVGVKKKLERQYVRKDRLVPLQVEEVATDVQTRTIVAYQKPLSLVQRMRPCPPGFSIGHTAITAGTLGAYVKRPNSDDYIILSNNHVLADSNNGKFNDIIIQPGKADGGFSGNDHFAWLDEFARIRWDGDENGKKDKKAAKFLWAAWKAPANALAWLVGCPYRLQVSDPSAVEQPYPNLVDAAIVRPVTQGHIKLDYPFDIGELKGIRDLQLGDWVQKVGRTTEHTVGVVEGVNSMVKVSYGSGKVATFDDQLEIRSSSGEFSQPGDSGSAILTEDGYLGGLLFAGGSGVTIANRIAHVVSLLRILV